MNYIISLIVAQVFVWCGVFMVLTGELMGLWVSVIGLIISVITRYLLNE